jgi:hypothetical protein
MKQAGRKDISILTTVPGVIACIVEFPDNSCPDTIDPKPCDDALVGQYVRVRSHRCRLDEPRPYDALLRGEEAMPGDEELNEHHLLGYQTTVVRHIISLSNHVHM